MWLLVLYKILSNNLFVVVVSFSFTLTLSLALVSASGDGTQIQPGVVVQEGAVVEKNCILAAGSIVQSGTLVPQGQFWAGNPAKFVREVSDEEMGKFEKNAEAVANLAIEHQEEFLPFGTAHVELESRR